MNEKEIAEIRRRYRQGKSNISHVVGCYVNEEREIVARFDQSLTLSGQEEADKSWPSCAAPSRARWAATCWTSPSPPPRWRAARATSTPC